MEELMSVQKLYKQANKRQKKTTFPLTTSTMQLKYLLVFMVIPYCETNINLFLDVFLALQNEK